MKMYSLLWLCSLERVKNVHRNKRIRTKSLIALSINVVHLKFFLLTEGLSGLGFPSLKKQVSHFSELLSSSGRFTGN